jgi:hypothetical protein
VVSQGIRSHCPNSHPQYGADAGSASKRCPDTCLGSSDQRSSEAGPLLAMPREMPHGDVRVGAKGGKP